uniref:Uncharacterized protein n=1 Tax=Myotis myotis TaxID=51298 RepID=A0A7J7RDI7_MYOMY|nr:hypothetical protein mMyoMyo1_010373 [Myotis myotis]
MGTPALNSPLWTCALSLTLPLSGTNSAFHFNTLSNLDNCCHRNAKWSEIPSIQAFSPFSPSPLSPSCSTRQILLLHTKHHHLTLLILNLRLTQQTTDLHPLTHPLPHLQIPKTQTLLTSSHLPAPESPTPKNSSSKTAFSHHTLALGPPKDHPQQPFIPTPILPKGRGRN